jgi:hypothetical protein
MNNKNVISHLETFSLGYTSALGDTRKKARLSLIVAEVKIRIEINSKKPHYRQSNIKKCHAYFKPKFPLKVLKELLLIGQFCLLINVKAKIQRYRRGWKEHQISLSVETSRTWMKTGRCTQYESVFKSFRIGRLERELQMVQLSATRCSCIAIL